MVDYPDSSFSDLLREKVEKWLMADAWKLEPFAEPETAWAVRATDENKRTLVVLQPSSQPDKLALKAVVGMNQGQVTKYKGLPAKERDAFNSGLRLDLIKSNHDYANKGEPPTTWLIGVDCYYDGLTKDSFLNRVVHMKLGVALIQWVIQDKLG